MDTYDKLLQYERETSDELRIAEINTMDFEDSVMSFEEALVVILILNLLFWLIVIIWRFCYLRKLNEVVERRRRELRGRLNDGADDERQHNPDDDIYALSRGDFPPSYSDAIKAHPIFTFETSSTSAAERRPEVVTVVTVPDEVDAPAARSQPQPADSNSIELQAVAEADGPPELPKYEQRIEQQNNELPPPLPKSPPPSS